jgi:DNA-binding Lrp family transcriptional regulator
MIFEIDFNRTNNNEFLIEKLGANCVDDFILTIDVKDFEHLEKILDLVDEELGDFYSAVISFDPPTIYLDNKV